MTISKDPPVRLANDEPSSASIARESLVWAEMVTAIADKSSRLGEFLASSDDRRSRNDGRRVVIELERERSRVARELHAGAGQPLAGIKLNLEMLHEWADDMPGPARDATSRLRQLAESALAEVRAVSHRLHPPDWQMLSTAEAIRRLLRQIGAEVSFAQAILDIHELPAEPSHLAKISLYRCAQEGVSNVIRHSGATRIEVYLTSDQDCAQLVIRDNGKGIVQYPSFSGGLGLSAIREHASAAGGNCKIKTGGDGTTITIRIPLTSDE